MLNTAAADGKAAASATVFTSGLAAEQEALGTFIGILQAEQEVLVHGDAERLAALAPDKATQIELLDRLGGQRKRHLAAQNLTDSEDGMLAWLSRNPGLAAAVRKLWRELLVRAETARQINQTNGLLIDNRLQQTRGKLAVLQTTAASEGVYRQDGQLRAQRNVRARDQA